MSLKTTMFQEIPFNSIRGESPTKTLPTNSRTGQKHYTLRNFVAWGIWISTYEQADKFELTTLFSSPGCGQGDILPSLCVRLPSVRRKLFIQRSSPLKLLGQLKPKVVTMVLRWSPFKIVSGSCILYPRWLPLLKIQIMSNGQNCCIWSHDGLKFVLYELNYVLFSSPGHRPFYHQVSFVVCR